MEDRQFLRLLAIVVASGLVLGLVAFGVGRHGDAGAAGVSGAPRPAATASATGSPNAGSAAAADRGDSSDPSIEQEALVGNASATNEPAGPPDNPPATRGPANLDPPGSAIVDAPVGAPIDPAPSAAAPADQPPQ